MGKWRRLPKNIIIKQKRKMKTNKVFYIAFLLFFSFSLSAQEDVSVEFSFDKPGKFVCEIKNKTAFEMDIWFNHLKDGPFTDIRFDIIGFPKKDTVRNLPEQFKMDPPYRIRLDSGQVYTRIFHTNWQYIKATVFVKYSVKSPTRRWGSYEKTFDLEEIRKEAYQQPIQKKEEEE
jgi:hypothetical protein